MRRAEARSWSSPRVTTTARRAGGFLAQDRDVDPAHPRARMVRALLDEEAQQVFFLERRAAVVALELVAAFAAQPLELVLRIPSFPPHPHPPAGAPSHPPPRGPPA